VKNILNWLLFQLIQAMHFTIESKTSENIHLNSFMYEPILDMSAVHLY